MTQEFQDPFEKDGSEFFDMAGHRGDDNDPGPDIKELERLGMRKICTACTEKTGETVFMETVEGTMADIYNSDLEDDTDVRTWAICKKCRKVVLIA